jgi:hypothetical protein
MILSIQRRYRAVTLTASMATRTEYWEGSGLRAITDARG